MRKQGLPERNEIVVCEITKINPNSAYARLLEYKATGMIHVSEIAKRWVRNISEFVKENQLVVCRVGKVESDYISLSVKRVNKNQAERKLQEFKRERNAEKLLEQVGKQFGKKLEETYDEVGHQLQENFGSINKTFEMAIKNPDLIKEKGIDSKWADAIIETAKKSFVEKTYSVTAKLKLSTLAPDGVDVIRKALLGISGKGLDVRYISAPLYHVSSSGRNIRQVKESVENACTEAVGSVEKMQGSGSFVLKENK